MSSSVPIGQRFSHVYLRQETPSQDSPRMRRRLASLIQTFKDIMDGNAFREFVTRELGVDVPGQFQFPDWVHFFKQCELQDLLDVITLADRHLSQSGAMFEPGAMKRWRVEVQRIFSEENVHYRLDATGGVHFSFDAEFARNQIATISALQSPRYANVANEFQAAMSVLGKGPPDAKAGIRNTFSAAEGLFKLMFTSSPRLTAAECQKLEPVIQAAYAGNAVALNAAMKLLNSLKDWVDCAHFYRHEHGHEEPTPPPLTLAVQIISQGAAFIRWLAELDSSVVAGVAPR